MRLLQKLIGYYKTWSEEWANRIAEEYQNLEDDEENEEEGPESLNSPGFGKKEKENQCLKPHLKMLKINIDLKAILILSLASCIST